LLARTLFAALALAALVLVLGWLATRVLTHMAEREYPLLGRRLDVAGLRQHVVELGAGPPVVFVHGAFGGAQDFVATIADELSRRYRCVVWDRPGHGYSDRPSALTDPGGQARLLLATICELGLERPLLVAFSYGGAVALAAGLREPDSLRGLVLLNAPSHPWPEPLEFHYELPTVPVLGPLVVETWLMPIGELLAGRSSARAFSPLPLPAAFAASPVALSLRPASYRANAEDLRELKPFLRAQSEHYRELALPLTLVVSEGDQVVSPTIHSPALHAAVPESEMIRIPGAGHQILYTHPRIVVDAIDAAMGDG
jgi:pimeloyl-ACP methyl ester carboxylesterase